MQYRRKITNFAVSAASVGKRRFLTIIFILPNLCYFTAAAAGKVCSPVIK